MKSFIYQTAQIREFERLAAERFGLSPSVLMQRAGKAAFEFLLRRWPHVQSVMLFCGGGNNGGDGYVLAALLKERGLKVSVCQVGNHDAQKPEAKEALQACEQLKVPMFKFETGSDLGHPDLLVDAICGIGAKENLREELITIIHKMARTRSPIFSLDIPTGVDADTGRILGEAVRASATMTFIGLKLGLLTGSGIAYTGELALNDLQIPIDLFAYVKPVAEKILSSSYNDYLKPRPRDWHKGLTGHVLVIGGTPGFAGAVRLAGEAALRVGAGLVSVATHEVHAAALTAGRPELMCHAIRQVEDLEPLIKRADVIVLGPGLGQNDWSKMMMNYFATVTLNLPLVIDADGLNWLSTMQLFNDNWVLTPHPGEAARLLDETPDKIQQDRLAACKALNKRYGGVSVLKGAGTLVLASNSLPALCDKGNPGMASGGMGDALSGMIAGFIAQDVPIGDAAKLAVYIHAAAGDLAAKEGERGMIASDLMPFIRRLSNIKINE